jgi:hypothetical protein
MNIARSSGSTLVVLTAAALASCSDHRVTAPPMDAAVQVSSSSRAAKGAAVLQQGKLFRFDDLAEVSDASASLLRNRSGLRFAIRTAGLPPGDAVTIWWVVFNFPEHCQHPVAGLMLCSEPDLFDEEVAATVLFAAGNLIGGSGSGGFAGSLNVADLKGCQPPFGDLGLCRQGLLNPDGAEVHFVVRSHGPNLRGLVSDQIRTFAGGCTPETSFGAGTGPNECQDLQFAIVLAP